MLLTNSGTISATGPTITVDGSGGSRVVNTGTIQTSDIFAFLGGAGGDIVINRGTIVGYVQLGNGTNTFDNRGGTFHGNVEGGRGSDFYYFDVPTFGILDTGGTDGILTSQSYSLTLNAEIESLRLLEQAESGEGNALGNTLTGNILANTLSGLAGQDTLNGDNGADSLFGGADSDVLNGGDGDDSQRGGGSDTLHGGEGDDLLRGDAGADRLYGEDGEDVLHGGAGCDTLYGGADADVFLFRQVADSGAGGAVRDVVLGFEAGLDLIDLAQIDANTNATGNQAITWIGIAGQLRLLAGANSVLQGDVNADSVADFEMQFNAIASIGVNDILL